MAADINQMLSRVSGDADDYNEVDRFFDNLPLGYRFCPTDEELVVFYLKNKILNQPLSLNFIRELNIYDYSPRQLTENYKSYGLREWYYFTPRAKKYAKGTRPNRVALNGYWKASGIDKQIEVNGMVVAYKKTLVFYEGKTPYSVKTGWIMHEYRLEGELPKKTDKKLDCVLCKISKKDLRKTNKKESDQENEDSVSSSSLGVREETHNFESSTFMNNQLQNQFQPLQPHPDQQLQNQFQPQLPQSYDQFQHQQLQPCDDQFQLQNLQPNEQFQLQQLQPYDDQFQLQNLQPNEQFQLQQLPPYDDQFQHQDLQPNDQFQLQQLQPYDDQFQHQQLQSYDHQFQHQQLQPNDQFQLQNLQPNDQFQLQQLQSQEPYSNTQFEATHNLQGASNLDLTQPNVSDYNIKTLSAIKHFLFNDNDFLS